MRTREHWAIKEDAVGSIDEERYIDLEAAATGIDDALARLAFDPQGMGTAALDALHALLDQMEDRKHYLEAALAEHPPPPRRTSTERHDLPLPGRDHARPIPDNAAELRVGTDYVRMVDLTGHESVYWDRAEFAEDPYLFSRIMATAVGRGLDILHEIARGEDI